jgi:hypothetical protein
MEKEPSLISNKTMDEEECEYKWFWEVDDGIYDLEGDLLIWSLMGLGILSLMEAVYYADGFTKEFEKSFTRQLYE